jgi:hypothetical protein
MFMEEEHKPLNTGASEAACCNLFSFDNGGVLVPPKTGLLLPI